METQEAAGFFHREHDKILVQLGEFHTALIDLRCEGRASLGKNLRKIKGVVAFLKKEAVNHMEKEEKILFLFLKIHIPRLESVIRLLEFEHKDFQANLAVFEAAMDQFAAEEPSINGTALEKLEEVGTYLIYLLRHHIQMEKGSIYQVLESDLRPDERRDLADLLAEAKSRMRKR